MLAQDDPRERFEHETHQNDRIRDDHCTLRN